MTDAERRRWAQAYLKCDPDTGEPGHQEMVTVDDLVRAMEAEAAYRVSDVVEAIEVVSYPGDRGCDGGYRLEIRLKGVRFVDQDGGLFEGRDEVEQRLQEIRQKAARE